jgi:hypothetical protein
MEVGGQRHAPAALSPGKNRYPLYRRLGVPQGRSGRLRNTSSPTEFAPRTLFLTSALDESGWSKPRPGRFIPGKEPVPIG